MVYTSCIFNSLHFLLPPLSVSLTVPEVVQVVISVLLVPCLLPLTVGIVSIHVGIAWCVSVGSAGGEGGNGVENIMHCTCTYVQL